MFVIILFLRHILDVLKTERFVVGLKFVLIVSVYVDVEILWG